MGRSLGYDEAVSILDKAGYELDVSAHDWDVQKDAINDCIERINSQKVAEPHGNYDIGHNDGLIKAASECRQIIIKKEGAHDGNDEYEEPYNRCSEGFFFPS